MKVTYVSLSSPIIFKKFEKNEAPSDWMRLDIAKEKLKTDFTFRLAFFSKEIEKIERRKE